MARRIMGGKGDILLIRGYRNICMVFGFCTTYGSREASIEGRVSSWKFEVSSQRGPGAGEDAGLKSEKVRKV
jgi:hypothetical protein